MSTIGTAEEAHALGGVARERDARGLLGHVIAFVVALACAVGLHCAAAKGREQLAIGLV